MIEKPPTVLALFEGHPERWTQGQFARDQDGRALWPNDNGTYSNEGRQPVSFCLSGAINFVYGGALADGEPWNRLCKHLQQPLSEYNDAQGRTFDEIVETCRAAGI